ncbi:class IV adenylate cyclase [archaeon]|jgi:adenylate cyclase, class 2|nr:class IV adenylate cyclase [archaeon]
MEEIELKILEVNHKDLEPKLISLGAKKIFDGELYALFFDDEESKIRKSGETLRLRKEGDKIFITHKKIIPSEDMKIRDETEIEVSNFEEAKKLITSLGFKEFKQIRKRRISYKLDNIKFEFDTFCDEYDFVPEFLEIETTNTKDIDKIYKCIESLGFSKNDCKPWTGKEVIEYYSKKK